jgi:protein-disulfide isomerase
LIDAYGDQIRFVYRDFPLESIHANAKPAAEAANCANEQGEFWEYHDKLFSMELGLSSEAYQEYATQLGLDIDEFQECFESGRYQEEVQLDFEFAANLGVRSTPTFFVNGIAVVGAQPFEVFQQVIEKELAGEIP